MMLQFVSLIIVLAGLPILYIVYRLVGWRVGAWFPEPIAAKEPEVCEIESIPPDYVKPRSTKKPPKRKG